MSVVVELRDRCAESHAQVEATLDLMSPDMTTERYIDALTTLAGFYGPLERDVQKFGDAELAYRPKRPWLESDLRHFGIGSVLWSKFIPCIDSTAAAYGAAYVLEGASLGGRHIERHARMVLSLDDEGTQFFRGDGEEVPRVWKQYRQAVTAFVERQPDQRNVVLDAAAATFESLQIWCRGVNAGSYT